MGEIKTLQEGVGMIHKDGVPHAIIVRDPKSGHQVFYSCTEMGLEDILEVIDEAGDNSVHNVPISTLKGGEKKE